MTSFAIPFSLTPTGQISTTSSPAQVANDRMESLIGTFPGERVMLPDYGVAIPSMLFSPDIPGQEDQITLQVQNAAAQWESSLIINNVSVNTAQLDVGITTIDVNFSLSNDPQLTPPQTATLEIGGTVIG